MTNTCMVLLYNLISSFVKVLFWISSVQLDSFCICLARILNNDIFPDFSFTHQRLWTFLKKKEFIWTEWFEHSLFTYKGKFCRTFQLWDSVCIIAEWKQQIVVVWMSSVLCQRKISTSFSIRSRGTVQRILIEVET